MDLEKQNNILINKIGRLVRREGLLHYQDSNEDMIPDFEHKKWNVYFLPNDVEPSFDNAVLLDHTDDVSEYGAPDSLVSLFFSILCVNDDGDLELDTGFTYDEVNGLISLFGVDESPF